MLFKIEREGSSAWKPWYSVEMFKLVFNVFREYQGCNTDGLSVSVYGGMIIYMYDIYIYMIILNSCSLKSLKKVHFFTLTCVFYWTQTPIFTVTRKIDNTCVINMLFDSDNTYTNKVISNLWVLLSSPNYLRLPLILLPYRCWFNGRFLPWCCCVKTNRIFRGWTKDYLCGVSKIFMSSTNDITN